MTFIFFSELLQNTQNDNLREYYLAFYQCLKMKIFRK